jgi:hypothetical protein
MIVKVLDKPTLNDFIFFIKDLYKNHNKYTYPIFFSVKKELAKIVLEKKTYTAIVCKIDGKVCGRLLYTIDYSKQRKENIGYFSYFDCIDNAEVAKELFEYMEKDLTGKVSYIEGTYSPFDPDTRRGILVKGFEYDHTFMTSYNHEYYEKLLLDLGYEKAYDTYTVSIPLAKSSIDKVSEIGAKMESVLDVSIDNLNLKNIDKDIVDIHSILQIATTQLNYQEAPSLEVITKFANSVKLFLNPQFVKIARENSTGKAVGFCLVLPDYNQILKKSKGKINPILFLANKNKINSVRGILQYVVPEYQKKGLIALIYYKLYKAFEKFGIIKFEGGTILENNSDSWGALVKFGGEISKIYRIMGKNL